MPGGSCQKQEPGSLYIYIYILYIYIIYMIWTRVKWTKSTLPENAQKQSTQKGNLHPMYVDKNHAYINTTFIKSGRFIRYTKTSGTNIKCSCMLFLIMRQGGIQFLLSERSYLSIQSNTHRLWYTRSTTYPRKIYSQKDIGKHANANVKQLKK